MTELKRLVDENLLVIANGVININHVTRSRFGVGIVRADTDHTHLIKEISTGRTFYRLGQEFLSTEALLLVARSSPLEEVRILASDLLSEALERQAL